MAISSDWEVNFVGKIISHIDGSLDYKGVTTGVAPEYGDYLRGATTGAVGKIINGTIGQTIPDVSSTGTVVLTNVVGKFQDSETLRVLDMLPFDTVTNSGFQIGETLQTSTGASITVDALEYHYSQSLPASFTTTWPSTGFGMIFGRANSTAFANNDVLVKSTATSTQVALVDTTTTAYVAGDAWTGAQVNEATTGTISPPSGSRSVIINFDSGAEAIPRFAKVQDTNDATPAKTGIVQKVYGVTATGSLRLVDVSGTWANNNGIYVTKLPYDGLGSTSFKVGDKIVTKSTDGGSVQGSGKVIVVQTLSTANSGKLTLQNMSGTFDTSIDNYYIYVRTTTDTSMALVNTPNTANFYDGVATVNGAEITEHLASQGGIYHSSDGLNIVRDSNALYTFLQDTFDELGALDDTVPMTAQVALQQFTLVNGWKIPDLSFRFLESGSIQDSSLDNIWTNYQTIGSVEGIGNTVYAAVTPLPLFYIAQSTTVLSTFWLTGHVDVLIKVKTNTRPDITVSPTGALINSGTVTIFNRNFGDTYDHFETTTIAGVAPVPLATAADTNNTSGTHRISYDGGVGSFTSGEEIRTSGAGKRGIITSIAASTGTVDYILLTPSTNFVDNDAITGQYSAATANVTQAPTNLVAGYQTQIVIATVDGTIAGSGSTAFYNGEAVTQATSNAKGIMMSVTGGVMTLGNVTGTFNSTNVITGDTSAVTFTPSAAFTTASTINRDIQDGNGPQPYNAVIYLDRDGDGSGDTLARMYEWIKYRTQSLELAGEPSYNLLGGPGTAAGVAGRLYTTLDSTYALVKASPLGTFAGGTFFGARGVFVQNMASTDIRSYQLIDACGVSRNPPNLQSLTVTGLVSGDRVAVFRTTSGSIQVAEFAVSSTINTTVNGADAAIIEVKTNQRSASPLPQDVPSAATVRVLSPNGSGLYLSFSYSSIARSTAQFTLGSTIGNVTSGKSLVSSDNAFVVLIEQQATSTSVSNSIIYVTGQDIPILTRVRRKGILPFEVSGTFGSTGASVAAIRSFDSIVD